MGKAALPAIAIPVHAMLRAAILEAGPHYQSGDRVIARLYFNAVATALNIPPATATALMTALGGRHALERTLAPRIDDIRHELLIEQSTRGRR